MILEGIVTTLDETGRLNVAPMGPIVEPGMTTLRLRPFRTSQTYRNLKARPWGVFHVVDDVLLLARAAIGRLDDPPATFPAVRLSAGNVLASACRWYEFTVETLDDSQERTEILARVEHVGRLRDFFGFNRARHAVVEAAILATRLHILPRDDVLRQLAELRVPVEKTAGPAEREAFALIEEHVASGGTPSSPAGAKSPHEHVVQAVTVTTGARLHFGPLAVGATQGRQFGGVGMMIDEPGFAIAATPLSAGVSDDVCGGDPSWCNRGRELWARLRETSASPLAVPPVRVEILKTIPAHAGLGSGTQFALAMGQAFVSMVGDAERSLPRRAGRGLRSAIGTHGFFAGGLIVDGGKPSPESVGSCAARVVVPDAWRVLLVIPREAAGLSGAEEQQAFHRLDPMPSATTDRLCRIALLGLLPAIADHDWRRASESLGDFSRVAGEYFAPVQGGAITHPAMRRLAEELRSRGFQGVGQTSWGPTLFLLLPHEAMGQQVRGELRRDPLCAGCDIRIARPLNRGRLVVVV